MHAVEAGCDRAGASVRRFHHVDVEVVIEENAAADAGHSDRAVLNTEFVYGFADEFVHVAVVAARAEVEIHVLQARGFSEYLFRFAVCFRFNRHFINRRSYTFYRSRDPTRKFVSQPLLRLFKLNNTF